MASTPLKADMDKKIAAMNREAEERDAKRRAEKFGLPYANFSTMPLEMGALELVEEKEARDAKLAVFERTRRELAVGVFDPENSKTKTVLKKLEAENYKLKVFVGSLSGLGHIWRYYEFVPKKVGEITGKVEIDRRRLEELSEKLDTLEEAKKEVSTFVATSPAVPQLLEILLATAITLQASDVHFEPGSGGVKFRIRIDGLLHDIFDGLKSEDYFFLISRIKLLSNLKLNVHDSPQDGRFTIDLGLKQIEIRASVLPSEYGETAVLRLLDPGVINLKLEDLGLRPDDLKIIATELERPNGMILNTGPTGSGKTTTLYAFLLHVNKPEMKIVTIEDPIEYHVQGIEQTQVNPEAGYTFASGLRSVVRQDPDVVLVGEIRDDETADVALNASLTGHLVFSTLHTNDSFGAIPRLVELGVKPAIIGPALNLIIAQRLARKLCENCKEAYKPDKEILDKIRKFLKKLPARIDGLVYREAVFYKARGCKKCGDIGYKGRVAIFELLLLDEGVKQAIHESTSEALVRQAGRAQEVITLQQDGILKILKGITTFDEVVRVTGPLEWQS